MRNKFLTKILGTTLGLAMAIGVGVGVANYNNKAVKEVNADAGEQFQLVTDASTLSSNDKIVIGSGISGSSVYLLSTTQNSSNRTATGTFTVSNSKVTLTAAVQVLTLGVTNSHWTFNTGSGYLYAASSSSNQLKTQANNNANGEWTISINANGNATVTAQGSNSRNILKYNANNGNPIFSCYSTSGTVAIYKKVSAATVSSVSLAGDMSTTSYTTVQKWNNAGLTATVNMSDSSQYDGEVDWSYSPASPATAFINNNLENVTGLSVEATASAGGKSDSKSTSGISVSLANVAQLTAATPASGDLTGVIARGIVSEIVEISIANHNATYYISDDGTTSGQYEVFRGKGLDNADIEHDYDIQVGDTVIVYGDVCTYKGIKEFKQDNYLLSIEKPPVSEVSSVTVVGNASVDANNAVSVAEEFDYEVVYEDPSNPGTGAVEVEVLNSSSTTDGASVTTAPAGGTFTITFTASDTYTVTVTSAENPAKSDSTTIVVSNIYVPVTVDYKLYEGTTISGDVVLLEGDYVFYADGGAMEAYIDSDRAQYVDVTPVSNTLTINDTDTDIVWHIAKSGEYYTIYNAAEDKYLASTGAKNKAQLLADGTDDMAMWSYTITDGKFDFVNKKNTENKVNANLRKNDTYGFACYGSGTGDMPYLYRKNAKAEAEETLVTRSSLAYNATKNGENDYTFSNVYLRFGGIITQGLWTQLHSESTITSYGVLFSTKEHLGVDELKSKYNAADGTNVKKFSNPYDPSSEEPNKSPKLYEHSTYQGVEDNYYVWNLRCSIAEADYTRVYAAVAFIVTDSDGVVFLGESRKSVKNIAADMIAGPNYDASSFEGSLNYLANLAGEL